MELATRHPAASAAWAAIDRRQYQLAGQLITQILAVCPHDPEGHRAWGHVLLGQGRIDDAVEAFSHAVQLDLVNPQAHFELAAALIDLAERGSPYFRDAHWARAIDALNFGLALDPEDERGQDLLDLVRSRRGHDRRTTVDRTPGRMVMPTTGPYAVPDAGGSLDIGLRIVLFLMGVLPAGIYLGLPWATERTAELTTDRLMIAAALFIVSTLIVRVFITHPLMERRNTIVL